MAALALRPETIAKGIGLMAQGHSQLATSKTLGISPGSTSKIVKNYQPEIDRMAVRIAIDTLESVRSTHVNLLMLASDISKALVERNVEAIEAIMDVLDKAKIPAMDVLKLADGKASKTLKMLGLLATNTTPSIFIQQNSNAGRDRDNQDPAILECIQGQLSNALQMDPNNDTSG